MKFTDTIGFVVVALAASGCTHPDSGKTPNVVDKHPTGVRVAAYPSTWHPPIPRAAPGSIPNPPVTAINPTDGAEIVYVPAGEFTMGSTDEKVQAILESNSAHKPEWLTDEKPQHRVYLDGYWVYKNDVTVGQYQKFCTATGHAMPDSPPWGWKEDHPIVNVTWDDAKAYCAWAHAALPTEAEWEKAARGTDGREYPWGSTFDTSRLWRSVDENRSSTAPVGSFPTGASPYGCLDMVGNVGQWCADWFNEDYYKSAPPRNPTGPPTGESRVVRGGVWFTNNASTSAELRGGGAPGGGDNFDGFRGAVRAGEN